MPIYAYRCSACGHAEDVLQKMSDPRLTVCPACGESAYVKQVTAAGFQLKGSGWYVTDFRNGSGGGKSGDKPEAKTEAKGGAEASSAASNASAPASGDAKAPAATAPAPSTPATGA